MNEVNSNFTPWFIHFGPNVQLRRSQREIFARPPIAKKVPADNENSIRELRRVGVSLAFPARMLSKSILHTSKVSLCVRRGCVRLASPSVVVTAAENLISFPMQLRHHALITARLSPRRRKNYLSSEPNNALHAAKSNNNKNERVRCVYFPFEAQTAGSFYCVGSIQKNLLWLSVHSKQKAGALKTTTNKKSRETVDLLLHYSPGGLKSSLFYISSRRFAMFYLFLPARLLLFSL
jgi:hypothetical protein